MDKSKYNEAQMNMSVLFYERINELMKGISMANLNGNLELVYNAMKDLYKNVAPVISTIQPSRIDKLLTMGINLDNIYKLLSEKDLYSQFASYDDYAMEGLIIDKNMEANKSLDKIQLTLYKMMQECGLIIPYIIPTNLGRAITDKYT